MSAKTTKKQTTLAAAEKRQLKSELSALAKALHKVAADRKRETSRLTKEIRRLERLRARATQASDAAEIRISRRRAILHGRLFS